MGSYYKLKWSKKAVCSFDIILLAPWDITLPLVCPGRPENLQLSVYRNIKLTFFKQC